MARQTCFSTKAAVKREKSNAMSLAFDDWMSEAFDSNLADKKKAQMSESKTNTQMPRTFQEQIEFENQRLANKVTAAERFKRSRKEFLHKKKTRLRNKSCQNISNANFLKATLQSRQKQASKESKLQSQKLDSLEHSTPPKAHQRLRIAIARQRDILGRQICAGDYCKDQSGNIYNKSLPNEEQQTILRGIIYEDRARRMSRLLRPMELSRQYETTEVCNLCYAAYSRLRQEILEEEHVCFIFFQIRFFSVRNFVPNDFFLKYFSKIHIYETERRALEQELRKKQLIAASNGPGKQATDRLAIDGARRAAERNLLREKKHLEGKKQRSENSSGIEPKWLWGKDGRRFANPAFDSSIYYDDSTSEKSKNIGSKESSSLNFDDSNRESNDVISMEDFDELMLVAGEDQFDEIVEMHQNKDYKMKKVKSDAQQSVQNNQIKRRNTKNIKNTKKSKKTKKIKKSKKRKNSRIVKSKNSYKKHLVPMLMQGDSISRKKFDEMREYYPEIKSLAEEKETSFTEQLRSSTDDEDTPTRNSSSDSLNPNPNLKLEVDKLANSGRSLFSESCQHQELGNSELSGTSISSDVKDLQTDNDYIYMGDSDDSDDSNDRKQKSEPGAPCAESGCEGFIPNTFLPKRCQICAYKFSSHRYPTERINDVQDNRDDRDDSDNEKKSHKNNNIVAHETTPLVKLDAPDETKKKSQEELMRAKLDKIFARPF